MAEWKKVGEMALNLPPRAAAANEPRRPPASECPLCHGRGLVVLNNRATRCTCMQKRSLIARRREAGLSPAMQRHTFADFELKYYEPEYVGVAKLSLAAARDFVHECISGSATSGLLFTGPVGSGKTFLACAIANALLEEGQEVLFVVVPDLLEAIRSNFSRTGADQTRAHLEERARTVRVLVLDDLGAHNYTEWTINTLYSLLNYRLNHELPTVITTNLALQELEEYLGQRSTSRIVQHCRVYRLLVSRDIRHLVAPRPANSSSSSPSHSSRA